MPKHSQIFRKVASGNKLSYSKHLFIPKKKETDLETKQKVIVMMENRDKVQVSGGEFALWADSFRMINLRFIHNEFNASESDVVVSRVQGEIQMSDYACERESDVANCRYLKG